MELKDIECIEHDGRVVAVDSKKNIVVVAVEDEADCKRCVAGSICQGVYGKNHQIDIVTPVAGRFQSGDKVVISGRERISRKVVRSVTTISSILTIAIMVATYLLTGYNQGYAIVAGVIAMILSIVATNRFADKMAHEFVFGISKQTAK